MDRSGMSSSRITASSGWRDVVTLWALVGLLYAFRQAVKGPRDGQPVEMVAGRMKKRP